MLPALEGDIRLKDETGTAFDTVIANAQRANQALTRTQSDLTRLEEVFAKLNVKMGQGGGFFDMLSGKGIKTDEVLKRAFNADDLGGATYREIATQVQEYKRQTELAAAATATLSLRLGSVAGGNLAVFDRLGSRVENLKVGFAALEQRSQSLYERIQRINAGDTTATTRGISAQTAGIEKVAADTDRATQSLKLTQAEVAKLDEALARLNVRSDMRGGFFDMLSGGGLRMDDVLARTLAADTTGSNTFKEMSDQLRAYVETTRSATAASGVLAEKLGGVGAPGEDAFAKLKARIETMKTDVADLQVRSERFYKSLRDEAAAGGAPQLGTTPFGNIRETSQGILTIVGGAASVVAGLDGVRRAFPQSESDTFIKTLTVGLPLAAVGLVRMSSGLATLVGGMKSVGFAIPEKALDTFLDGMGKIPDSVKNISKLALGFGGIKDLIPETAASGFLKGMAEHIPGISSGFVKMAGGVGLVTSGLGALVSAAIYVNDVFDQMNQRVGEMEQFAANLGFLSFRVNTDTLEADLDQIQATLGARISERDLATIMLKIDPSSALSDLKTFETVARTVQAFADEFGGDWQAALDAVSQAIQRGDGAWLEQNGYIYNADKALNDYARSLGKSVPQLTDLEKQQGLANAVIKENATLVNEAKTNADIAREANERFTAQLADMKTALIELGNAFLDNRMNALMNWFADDSTMGPAMASMEKWMSDLAGNERIRAQLSDVAEENFDRLLAERDRLSAQITDFTAAIPAAEAGGDETRVNWLKENIQQLEARMKAIDASIGVAREDVFAGRPVTPLPRAIDNSSIAEQVATREFEVKARYELELAKARNTLEQATRDLASAELERMAATTGDPTSQMVVATYEAEIEKKKAAIESMDADIRRLEEERATPPTFTVDPGDQSANLSALGSQVEIINGQIGIIEGRVVALNNASNLVSQITALSEKIKALQDAGGDQAEIQRLTEERAVNLQNFLDLSERLNAQGIAISLPDMPIEQTISAINEYAGQSMTALERYRERLKEIEEDISETEALIAAGPQTVVDTESVRAIGVQLDALREKRALVQSELAEIEELLNRQQSTPEAVAAQAAAAQAESAQAQAQARVELLESEKAYLLSLTQVQQAAATGNVGMWEQAQSGVDEARSRLHTAYQEFFAANASDAQALIDANSRLAEYLGKDFLEDIASGRLPTLEIFKTDDISDQALAALDAAEKALAGETVEVPVTVTGDGPTAAEAMIASARKIVEDSKRALHGALASGDEEAIAAAQGNRDAAAAQAAQTIASVAYAKALNELTLARQSNNAVAIEGATIALQAAEATLAEASADADAAAVKANASSIKTALLTQSASEVASLRLIAIANREAAVAEEDHTVAMEGVAVAGGILVDAVSGLPLAFNAAALNATQLDSALADLETRMQQIEGAAISAGFSIANRLIPVMGLAGSLQQAGQWAQQARGITDVFEQINQTRMSEGQNPLGGEVLNASMDALRQSWNAMATDSVNSMRKVEGAGAGAAAGMENTAKRIDSALDGLVQGVLKDSTKGLIDVDSMLPRVDEVDEKARRMADVAKLGFKSPWYEGLSDLFPDEILAQGEGKVKEHAARLVRDHQQGLTTMFYDTDAAAQRVLDQLVAKQNMGEFVAGVRERVKQLGANVEDLDIMEALGIDVSDQKMGAAAQSAQKTMSEIVPGYQEIINQLMELGNAESPIIELLTPSEEGATTVKEQGAAVATSMGEEVVRQATEGAYGTRAVDAIINQMVAKKEAIQKAGRDLADWMGTSLTGRFRDNVPSELLDILIVELGPLMAAAQAKEQERQGVLP
ncbi:MAG TPA: hypothetical protein PKH77_13450 [Anaerolineae bacterium]|nr:hypothetical protein [Anaerolineae bacterium]